MIRRIALHGPRRRWYAAQHTYQQTLNLPNTKFPKRSDLKDSIDKLIPRSSQEVYKKQLEEFVAKVSQFDDDSQRSKFVEDNLFILHDGPPYANGDLHLGHALNKILKDFINRYQLSRGKYVFYKPGWDCHGLPIEMKALKDISANKVESIPPSEIRSMAKLHASNAIKRQREQFQHFGIMADWNDHYITMDSQYELDQLRVFQNMFSKGLIRRQNKPVFWGVETRTALAEGELEYNESHKSLAAYVKFPLTSESNLKFLELLPKSTMVEFFIGQNANQSISCLIWTTTPWTLVANRAICFNENLTYSLIQLENDCIIAANDLLDQLELPEYFQILAEFPGIMLKGLEYTNPLLRDGIPRPLIQADYVTNSTGTGLVHNAPGHGADDYLVGLKNGLEIFSPVDYRGRYKLHELPKHLHEILTENGEPRKVSDLKTSESIIEALADFGMMHKSSEYHHSYPYDWRSKTPIIVRATPQWFADLHDVKGLALKSIERVKFNPERGKTRLSSFIQGRNEWCISRQRSWGVPIPAFYYKDTPDVAIMTSETIEHVIEVIEKKGIDAWFSEDQSDMKDWLPPSMTDQSQMLVRGKDTMDVWFDSGTSWNVIKNFYQESLKLKSLPDQLADVYLEGSDQHRGWFQSSLLTKVACSGLPQAPYKQAVTHGFTLDESGIKMSKSIGNTISPEKIMKGDKESGLPALGVDGLRYLIAQADFTTDIVAGKTVISHIADSLKKFRLTFRFLLGNLNEGLFELIPLNELRPVDRYTIFKLQELLDSTKKHYDECNFSKVLTAIQYHMTNELSAFYFDLSKDCLYSDAKSSFKRQQIQTTLFHIYDAYRAIMMPILPILVQESWEYLPKQYLGDYEKSFTPFNRAWPSYEIPMEAHVLFQDELILLKEFQKQFKELAGKVQKPSQTVTIISTDAPTLPFVAEELKDILQTGKVSLCTHSSIEMTSESLKLTDGSKIRVSVQESDLNKCPRCWNYSSEIEDHLCCRCEEVTKKTM